jgi:hypothetical protein
MKASLLLLMLALGCGDSAPSDECDHLLPSSDGDGQPWPTYAVAIMAHADCTLPETAAYQRRRGACTDGKRFLERLGSFGGDIRYFDGDTLVGVQRWSDVGGGSCVPARLGDVDCDEVDVEVLSCP